MCDFQLSGDGTQLTAKDTGWPRRDVEMRLGGELDIVEIFIAGGEFSVSVEGLEALVFEAKSRGGEAMDGPLYGFGYDEGFEAGFIDGTKSPDSDLVDENEGLDRELSALKARLKELSCPEK